jgi:hypothetical protein
MHEITTALVPYARRIVPHVCETSRASHHDARFSRIRVLLRN